MRNNRLRTALTVVTAVAVATVAVFINAGAAVADGVNQGDCDPSNTLGNIVVNCGFETGDLTGWTPSGDEDGGVGGPGHSGSYSFFSGSVGAPYLVSQTLSSVTPNTTYTLSFYVYDYSDQDHDGAETGRVTTASVSNVQTASGTGTATLYSNTDTLPSSWTYVSATFTTPASVQAAPVLTFSIQNDPAFTELDDVSVVANDSLTLSAMPTSSTLGQSVTLTATLTSQSATPLGGTVNFTNNGTSITDCATQPVTPGTTAQTATATCTTTALPVGTDTLQADYIGDGTNPAADSDTVTYTVSPAPTPAPKPIGNPPACASANPFPDVTYVNAFCNDVAWSKQANIVTGYSDGDFHPSNPVSRQAMADFLYRFKNGGASAAACTSMPFTDVPVSSPFCADIAALKAQGVLSGFTGGAFLPSSDVSRQAMASFLYAVEHSGQAAPACTSQPFPDVPTSSEFCGAISWLKTQGLADGYSDGNFHPAADVTRQATVAFLHRLS